MNKNFRGMYFAVMSLTSIYGYAFFRLIGWTAHKCNNALHGWLIKIANRTTNVSICSWTVNMQPYMLKHLPQKIFQYGKDEQWKRSMET